MASPMDIVDTILKLVELGEEIHKRYKMYIGSEADLGELDTRIRAGLMVLEVFGKVIERGIGGLLYRHQEAIILLLGHLQGVFDRLDKQLSRFPRDEKLSIISKLRWTFKGKSGYEAVLQEMADWRREVHDVVDAMKLLQEDENDEDRVLYKQLFEVCGGPGVRSADAMDAVRRGRGDLSEPPALEENELKSLNSGNNLRDGNRVILKGKSTFVECRYSEARSPEEIQESIADVKILAAVLGKVDAPAMHILRCRGTLYQGDGFDRSLLFYEVPREPTTQSPWTLAQAIEDKRTMKPSLDARIRNAVEICTAVMFTHSAGLVHKSIQPENILILNSSRSNDSVLGKSAYLAGFDAARLRDLSAYSAQRAETDPLRRLYQHPERQLAQSDGKVVRFGIRHDMYSLGVVLLELAMWRRVAQIADPELQKLRGARGQAFDARRLQAKLVELVRQSFAGLTGPRYAGAVLCCLQDSVVSHKDEREMREMFYERVLQPLKQIAV
ncbi:hypothetical protein PENSPDRAFT_685932 [Peniophora sp. CONT]|nr:hypothetical protein PENSPDRAFT_685932 [Peniophora sp. CONT]